MNFIQKAAFVAAFLAIAPFTRLSAQTDTTSLITRPVKLNHAEPLYIDLIRDLGAHKGEKEWNIGAGLTDQLAFDKYEMLVEYEWAPIDRLGLEVEVPVTFYSPNSRDMRKSQPSDRVESLKTAMQYTFLVSPKYKTSMALGYINEIEFYDLNKISGSRLVRGNIYNPFFVAAKKLSPAWHTLIYTGPHFSQHFKSGTWHTSYALNSNLHYMLPESRNFIGVEVNKEFDGHNFDMVIRPQMRVSIMDNLILGLVTGIPVSKKQERLSTFIRLIYEPSHKHSHKRGQQLSSRQNKFQHNKNL